MPLCIIASRLYADAISASRSESGRTAPALAPEQRPGQCFQRLDCVFDPARRSRDAARHAPLRSSAAPCCHCRHRVTHLEVRELLDVAHGNAGVLRRQRRRYSGSALSKLARLAVRARESRLHQAVVLPAFLLDERSRFRRLAPVPTPRRPYRQWRVGRRCCSAPAPRARAIRFAAVASCSAPHLSG